MTDQTITPRELAIQLAHEQPGEALVYAVLDLADAFRDAWPPVAELMGDGPVPERRCVACGESHDPFDSASCIEALRAVAHGDV